MKRQSVKNLAGKLQKDLKSMGHPVPISVLLHGVARLAGDRNWHLLSANEKKDRSGLAHTSIGYLVRNDVSYLADLVGREIGQEDPEDRYLGHRRVPKNLLNRLEQLEQSLPGATAGMAGAADSGHGSGLTSDDASYIHELIAAEECTNEESRHLKEETPEGILERLAALSPGPGPVNEKQMFFDVLRKARRDLAMLSRAADGGIDRNDDELETFIVSVRDIVGRCVTRLDKVLSEEWDLSRRKTLSRPIEVAAEEEHRFRLFFRHRDCPVTPGVEWDTTWSCACNDKCPDCNREIEPFKVEDLVEGSIEYDEDEVPLTSNA